MSGREGIGSLARSRGGVVVVNTCIWNDSVANFVLETKETYLCRTYVCVCINASVLRALLGDELHLL